MKMGDKRLFSTSWARSGSVAILIFTKQLHIYDGIVTQGRRVKNWGRMAKIGFFGQKPKFWAPKKNSLLGANHVLATTGKSCSKKKVAFAQIIKGGNVILGDFLG